ncbi:hypothetical protein, partial [Pseudoalteromonas sp. S186]|uniref:hypothetical protein n=1 Tax=Pseudoalteromonas sp. S186 TaxID=2066521 RepID=UPI00110BD67E
EDNALAKEKDEASQKRRSAMQELITDLDGQYREHDEIWNAEKASLQGTQVIKAELEQARLDLDVARRARDLLRCSDLQYVRFP